MENTSSSQWLALLPDCQNISTSVFLPASNFLNSYMQPQATTWSFLAKWIFYKLVTCGTRERLGNNSNTIKDPLIFHKPQLNLWATQLWKDDKHRQLLQLSAEFLLLFYLYLRQKILNTKNLKYFSLQPFKDLEFFQTIFKGNSTEKLWVWITTTPHLSMYQPTKCLWYKSTPGLYF